MHQILKRAWQGWGFLNSKRQLAIAGSNHSYKLFQENIKR